MKLRIFQILYLLVSGLFIVYLLLPTPPFPNPPSDSVQSMEDADTETPLRRAYFTDLSRQEVIDLYKSQFNNVPTLRLNYPPEDSQTIIRDQTMSTFLEELAHPFRESIYINGFEPKEAKDDIWYKGRHFRQKIIIKYEMSNPLIRITIAVPTIILTYLVIFEWRRFIWKR